MSIHGAVMANLPAHEAARLLMIVRAGLRGPHPILPGALGGIVDQRGRLP